MQNFTHTVHTVESNLNLMWVHKILETWLGPTTIFLYNFSEQYQANSRMREARDYALIKDNESYVGTWSLVQIFVIIITTSVQVYFVRKLFDVKGGGYSRSRI